MNTLYGMPLWRPAIEQTPRKPKDTAESTVSRPSRTGFGLSTYTDSAFIPLVSDVLSQKG